MTKLVECNRCVTILMSLIKQDLKDLRVGRYNRVVKANAVKTENLLALSAALSDLEKQEPSNYKVKAYLAPRLAKLQSLANENGLLLQSVFNGLKSAQQRVDQLQHAQAHLGVYGRQGQALHLAEGSLSQEKKF